MAEMQKNLPCALEAEQSVLGSILIDPNCFADLTEIIRAEDFYLDEHGEIFYAMQDLFAKSREIDLVTLIDTLVSRGVYNEEESKKYIKIIAETVPSASNVLDYAKIVREKSLLRSLIGVSDEIRDMAFSAQGDVKDIIDGAEAKVFAIAQGSENKGFVHIREAISRTYARLDLLARDKNAGAGTPTGFSGLDRTIVGLGEGDLVLIGARPGMGKTSFAMNIATNIAKITKKNVCVFSLEMSADLLMRRLIAMQSCVSLKKIATGNLSSYERENVADAIKVISNAPIYIDDSPGLRLMDIVAKSRKLQAALQEQKQDLGLIIIDYLGLISGTQNAKSQDNRQEEVRKISLALKGLARDLKVPVIVVCQLSRDVEKRESKKPMMSDLRESGAIEQDADVVMLLYRDDYYNNGDKDNGIKTKGGKLTQAQKFEVVRAMKEKELGDQMPGQASYVEVNVAKNRNGQTGRASLFFYKEYGRFDQPSEEWEKAMMEVTKEDID